ncbi:MAG: heavy metal translocating P-type ATPase [Prevotella sp.]|nr:HAD-IC family P-type ATPase [Prevotella sp.]MDY4217916.1 heavy metal translocating P-type ATPase [Prevotella sp.]
MKKTIPVVGMACASCAAHIERHLNSLSGVAEVSVSLPTRSTVIDFDENTITLEELKQQVNQIGYDLIIDEQQSVEKIEKQAYRQLKQKTLLAWMFTLVVMAVSMHWVNFGNDLVHNQLAFLLTLVSMFVCGNGFYRSAYKQLLHRTANMDSLVALSTIIAFLFSAFNTFWGEEAWGSRGIVWHTYYDATTMITAFVLTGRLLEEKARDSMASSIRQLMGLAPKTARIVEGENISEVPISTIEIGDTLEVRAGEKIPVDGEVISAESFMKANAAYVDESMITGEPTPAEKQKGSKVLAGTVLSQGSFRMKARQVGEATALANIIRMVQEAQGSKAPVQRVVDRAALVFVPLVSLIALITFFAWWGIGGNTYLPQAIISAVSVLIIACPCAMGLATPTALMVGIGKAAQHHVLIKDAAALEQMRKIDTLVTDKTGTITLPNKDVDFTQSDHLALEEREQLKPHVTEVMTALQQRGIEIYMMSGDKEEAARYWAEKAGIKHYKSKVLPQDKENLVRRLQASGRCVAMMGDGINDTQALALADVGIAIGKGTDVAMDIAQITLMGDDLQALSDAFRLSKQTVKMIWQNLFWAFIYNLVCIPLAAGIPHLFGQQWQITPSIASALMAFSSVSIVLNSLRLKWMK